MYDLRHWPAGADVQTFIGETNGYLSVFHPYMVPPRSTFVSVTAIGSGGGGGGGGGSTAGSQRGGGGGGASGCLATGLFLAATLPPRIYVYVPNGGAGGASGSAGGIGDKAILALTTLGASYNDYILSTSASGGSSVGGAGTSSGGAGGTSLTVGSAAGNEIGRWALCIRYIAGNSGTVGGTGNAAGSSITIGTGLPILGGAGGGGCTSADQIGGGINALANTPFNASAGGPAASNGNDGFRWGQYPMHYGGTGGGSSNTTVGGRGGNGVAPGAGGGGGGAGVTFGGRGGNGGPGLVIIAAW